MYLAYRFNLFALQNHPEFHRHGRLHGHLAIELGAGASKYWIEDKSIQSIISSVAALGSIAYLIIYRYRRNDLAKFYLKYK